MGIGRIIGAMFGRRPAAVAADPDPVADSNSVSEPAPAPTGSAPLNAHTDLVLLWRAQRCLQPARLNALRDAIAGTSIIPGYVDAPDPYVSSLRDVDAVLADDHTLFEWLRRHDPGTRPNGAVAIDDDGIVFGPPEHRARLRLPRLALGSLDVAAAADANLAEVFTLEVQRDVIESDRVYCQAHYPKALFTTLRATDAPTPVDLGPSLQQLRLTLLRIADSRSRSVPCAVLDDSTSGERVVLCAALPRAALFSTPPGMDGPAPSTIVGGLSVRRRRPGAGLRASAISAAPELDEDTDDTPDGASFERGLTATQAAARLGRRSRRGLADRLQVSRLVVLTGARGVDAGGSIAMATGLGLSPQALGPRAFVPPSAAGALEALFAPEDDSWTAPNDLDAEHVTAALLAGGAPADVMQRLRDGLECAAPSAAFARGLLHEADGDVEAAIAAYEDAADVDSRADEQLLVLNDRLGQAIPPDELLSDDPPILPTLNRALLDWRQGRAAVARTTLENADVATLSPIGRAIHDELDAGQPASVKLPLVSPALADLVDIDVACAFLRGGDATSGVALLERALELEPLAVGAAATLATHAIRTGSPEVGLRALARVMQPGARTGTGLTEWTDGHGLRSEALARLGRYDDALAALDAMFESTSARLEARLTRIALLEALGRKEDARADAARLPADGADAMLTRRVSARLQRP